MPAAPDVSAGGTRCPTVRVAQFLLEHRDAYARAIARATAWLDGQIIDAVRLSALGLKGKKHLVEALDGYVYLSRIAGAEERERVLDRVRALAASTESDGYHDMQRLDEATFKRDATSYLRAAYLLDHLGVLPARYRGEIAAIHGRLDGQMRKRGVDQQMVFAMYYEHFGLREPFPLARAFDDGIISRQADPAKMTQDDMYSLTHEVFAPYGYGEQREADPFSIHHKRYLRRALPVLVQRRIKRGDPDLVAELVTCMRFLELIDLDAYRDGLGLIFSSQQEAGSWGDYERYRAEAGALVEVKYVLHTTTVVIEALALAFHPAWNQHVVPFCDEEDGK